MLVSQSSVSGRSVLRVRNWERFASKGKGGRRSMGRIPAAMLGSVGGLQALVRKRLLNLPGGAAAYGVWILLAAIAAETCVPGVFLDDDHTPLTVEDLALLTDVRLDELQTALDILSGPEVRLIETVSLEEALAVCVQPPAGTHGVPRVEGEDLILSEADPVANVSRMATDSAAGDVPDSTLHGTDEADESHLRRLKVTATAKPGSVPAKCDMELDGERDADKSQLRRLKVTATEAKPEDGGLDKIAQQMAQLAGVCQQIDQMKRHVAAMTNSTPILTASRKGRPNGWKVNATLNPGKK